MPDKSGSIDRRDLTMLLEGIVPKRIEKRYAMATSHGNLSTEKTL